MTQRKARIPPRRSRFRYEARAAAGSASSTPLSTPAPHRNSRAWRRRRRVAVPETKLASPSAERTA